MLLMKISKRLLTRLVLWVRRSPKKISADYADYADLKTKNFATESTEGHRGKKRKEKKS